MEISRADISDIPELCQLLSILFSQEKEFTPDFIAQAKGLTQIIENPDIGHIVIGRDNNEIVGMINVLFTISTVLGGRVAFFEDIVVIPTKRGVGIGSELLKYAIDSAYQCGCKRITLLTDNVNSEAQIFYLKNGFSRSSMVPFRMLIDQQS